MIEDVLEGKLRLPEAVARRAAGRGGKVRPFVVEPEVTINNQWSELYTVIEVSGLDRPGLLFQLTTALSKLNLNIGSAHVATFGERARDVFYVTDLLGAQINAPTRQAAIRSTLLHLLATDDTAAQPAAVKQRRRLSPPVIPGRAKREPGIHNHDPGVWIPGLRLAAHLGTTARGESGRIRYAPTGIVGWAKRSVPTILTTAHGETVGTARCAFAHPTNFLATSSFQGLAP